MDKTKKNNQGDFFRDMAKTLVAVIDEKGTHLSGHAERVAGCCVNFAREVGLPKKMIDKIYLAALFHDIGMVYIPMEILQKPGKLTEDEMSMVKQHPVISERILSNLAQFKGVVPIVRHHHEVFRGGGYPDGLRGDKIPIGSRILQLVDSYEAMISARTYRPALSMDEALARITEDKNNQFDERLVREFVAFIRSTVTFAEIKTESSEKNEKKNVKDILEEIAGIFRADLNDLPVLPKVVSEIESVINRPESDAKDLSAVIERDAAISIRLIDIANSPVYRGSDKIHNVKQAVTRLGLKETQHVVLDIASKSIYRSKNKEFMILMQNMWLHSLATAYAARGLAEKMGLEDVDRYFLMGLIHDIGKVLLVKSLTELTSGIDPFTVDEVVDSAQDLHCAFGAGFLERCKFTRDFVEVAMFHEQPKYFQTSKKGILVVNLANLITRMIGFSLFKDEVMNPPALESAKLLGIGFEEISFVMDEVVDLMKTTAVTF